MGGHVDLRGHTWAFYPHPIKTALSFFCANFLNWNIFKIEWDQFLNVKIRIIFVKATEMLTSHKSKRRAKLLKIYFYKINQPHNDQIQLWFVWWTRSRGKSIWQFTRSWEDLENYGSKLFCEQRIYFHLIAVKKCQKMMLKSTKYLSVCQFIILNWYFRGNLVSKSYLVFLVLVL